MADGKEELAQLLRDFPTWGDAAIHYKKRSETLTAALQEIVKRESRSEYKSIYSAPSEFARIARSALGHE
jgi:hypothetical protein